MKFPNWVRSCMLCQRYRDNECIPASSMWGDRSRIDLVVLQLAYKKSLESIFRQMGRDFREVEEGREAHGILERRRGVIRSLQTLVERLRDPSVERVVFTGRACSRFYGQRCHPDAVYFRLRRDAVVPTLEITILEDKKEFRLTYMMQLYAMGIIFTDFNLLMQSSDLYYVRTDLERTFMDDGVLLYDHLKNELGLQEMRVDVYLSLSAYRNPRDPQDRPIFTTLFSKDFKVVPEMERQFLATRRRRREVIVAIEKKKPYTMPAVQTHFTTRPRRSSKVVGKVDEKYALFVPKS